MVTRRDPLSELASRFLVRGDKVVTAESCTGGLLASTLTSLPGSSAWFEGSFVTYSIAAKHRMLGIPTEVIDAHGAVSERVALDMAAAAADRLHATVGVSVTGLAGPEGDGSDTPVGTVWIGAATANEHFAKCHRFHGSRTAIRDAAVQAVLAILLELTKAATENT